MQGGAQPNVSSLAQKGGQEMSAFAALAGAKRISLSDCRTVVDMKYTPCVARTIGGLACGAVAGRVFFSGVVSARPSFEVDPHGYATSVVLSERYGDRPGPRISPITRHI